MERRLSISSENFRDSSKIHENCESFLLLNFCCLRYNTIRHTLFNFRGRADNKASLKLCNSLTFCLTYKFDQFTVAKNYN